MRIYIGFFDSASMILTGLDEWCADEFKTLNPLRYQGMDRIEAHYLKQYYLRVSKPEDSDWRLFTIVGNVVKDAPQWWPVLIKELVADLKRKRAEVFVIEAREEYRQYQTELVEALNKNSISVTYMPRRHLNFDKAKAEVEVFDAYQDYIKGIADSDTLSAKIEMAKEKEKARCEFMWSMIQK